MNFRLFSNFQNPDVLDRIGEKHFLSYKLSVREVRLDPPKLLSVRQELSVREVLSDPEIN